jgi:hypothetical protein
MSCSSRRRMKCRRQGCSALIGRIRKGMDARCLRMRDRTRWQQPFRGIDGLCDASEWGLGMGPRDRGRLWVSLQGSERNPLPNRPFVEEVLVESSQVGWDPSAATEGGQDARLCLLREQSPNSPSIRSFERNCNYKKLSRQQPRGGIGKIGDNHIGARPLQRS